MSKKQDEKNIKREIVEKVVSNIVKEETNQALNYAHPKLIKESICNEIKSMVKNWLVGFIYIASSLIILNFIYISSSSSSVDNMSLGMVKTLNESLIIKNYLILGINYLLAFALISFVRSKFRTGTYEKNRKNIISFRNVIYLLFIVSFSLQSFTVEQLDLVSLVISLIVLFKVLFMTDNTLTTEEFIEIAEKIIINNWANEIEQEKLEKKRNEENR